MKSWLEISATSLRHNLHALAAASGRGTELLAVVKANAYGHGLQVVAPTLAAEGVRWFGVSDVAEGIELQAALKRRKAGILIMCGMLPGDARAIVRNGLTPVIWTPAHITALDKAARAARRRIDVHVEVDTGMARQGCSLAELPALLEQLNASHWTNCTGIMTHLAASEVAHGAQTEQQRQRFEAALDIVQASGIRPGFVHLGNSSAIDEGSTMQWLRSAAKRLGATPMVRPGLALYGHALPVEGSPTPKRLAKKLRPIATWKTRIIGLRDLVPGDTVGYGATFTATALMRVALLPVGYADGLRREASGGCGWVMLGRHRAPVVGRVSMNLTVVDVTAIPRLSVGDEVILLGPGVTAADHAAWSHTIPYEILCALRTKP